MPLGHIKPHGALYGMAARQDHVAHAVCDAADVFAVPILCAIGTLHETAYPARGRRFVAEYCADLDYDDGGGLVIAREHAAVDPERAAARALRAVRKDAAWSICVHSDTPNAVAAARAVRSALAPYLAAA